MVFQRAVMRRMKHHHHQHSNATVYDDISPSKFAGTPMILGGSPNGTGGGGGDYDVGDEDEMNSFLSKCSLLDSSVGRQEGVAAATVEKAVVEKAVMAVENDGAPKTPYVVKRDPPTDYHGEASSRDDDDDESLFQFQALNESLMKRDDCPPGTTPKKKKTMGAVRIQVERSNNNPTSAAASPSPPPQTPFAKHKSNGHNNMKSILSSMTNNNNNNDNSMNVSVEVITTPQSVLHGLAITDHEAVVELDEFVMATPSFKTPILTTSTTSAATTATTTPAATAATHRAATATNNNNITPPSTTTTEVVTPRMFQSSPLLTPQLGDTSLSSDMKGLSFLETSNIIMDEEDLVQQQHQLVEQQPQTAKKKVLNQRNSPTMFQSSPLNSEVPNDSILMQSMSSFIVHDNTNVGSGVDGVGGGGDGAQRELFDSINSSGVSSGEEEKKKDARKEANLVRGRALLSIASEDETDCDDDNGGGSGSDKGEGDDEFENVSKLGVDFFKLSVNSGGADKEVPAGEETTNTKKMMVDSSFASPTGVTNFHQDEDFTSSAAASPPPTKTSSSSLISRWLDSAFGGCGSLESITCGSKNGNDGAQKNQCNGNFFEESSSSSSAAAAAASATTKNQQQKSWLPVTTKAPPPSSLNRPGLVQRDVSPAEELSLARQNANMTHQLYTNENKNFRVRG